MVQFNASVAQTCDDGIVGHHHNGASLAMQFAQQPEHDLFICGIQISSRLVGENDFRIIDQCASNAHPLLFAA